MCVCVCVRKMVCDQKACKYVNCSSSSFAVLIQSMCCFPFHLFPEHFEPEVLFNALDHKGFLKDKVFFSCVCRYWNLFVCKTANIANGDNVVPTNYPIMPQFLADLWIGFQNCSAIFMLPDSATFSWFVCWADEQNPTQQLSTVFLSWAAVGWHGSVIYFASFLCSHKRRFSLLHKRKMLG